MAASRRVSSDKPRTLCRRSQCSPRRCSDNPPRRSSAALTQINVMARVQDVFAKINRLHRAIRDAKKENPCCQRDKIKLRLLIVTWSSLDALAMR